MMYTEVPTSADAYASLIGGVAPGIGVAADGQRLVVGGKGHGINGAAHVLQVGDFAHGLVGLRSGARRRSR